MSLYDGFEDKDDLIKDKEAAGWGSRMKLLETQQQIQAKKASLLNLKKKQAVTVAPVINLKRRSEEVGPVTFNHLTGKMERQILAVAPPPPVPPTPPAPAPVAPVVPFLGVEPPATSFLGVSDEYNPMFPNEYEEFSKKRRDQRKREREDREFEEREKRRRERHRQRMLDEEAEEQSEFERRRRRREEQEREEQEEDEEDEDEAERRKYDSMKRGGAAIAPPPMLIEDDKHADSPEPIRQPSEPMGASMGLMGSVASKIMAKMGYREGQGLGRLEQGMSTALQVEKTSKRGGKIIHERDIPKNFSDADMFGSMEPPRQEISNANLLKNPSKVLLLRNMVGPGEVDEDLEPETGEECGKYGKVTKCLIFEMPGVEEEEAVRIFVEFERQESAIKAVVDLNGRFFGGRIVKAGFYNLDKFRTLDLTGPMD